MADDVALMIAGHDQYAQAWKPLMWGFHKYWPDCPWKVYFITNHLAAPYGCETIKVGGDFNPKKWSDRMIRGLERVPAKTVLWLLDDHWLSQKPDVAALMDFAKLVQDDRVARLRLYPGWDHDRSSGVFEHDKRLLVMGKKSPYRTSCKPSFCNREVFLSLLKQNESPWDFERNGRRRSVRHTFVATKGWHFYFVTRGCPDGIEWPKSPLVKGKWTLAAQMYCKREGIKIDFRKHPVGGNPFGKDRPEWILP